MNLPKIGLNLRNYFLSNWPLNCNIPSHMKSTALKINHLPRQLRPINKQIYLLIGDKNEHYHRYKEGLTREQIIQGFENPFRQEF